MPCPAPPPPTLQTGVVIEPHISIGAGGSSGTAKYDSTGFQEPFDAGWSHDGAQVCGGATFWPGLGVGPVRIGIDVNACSGTGSKTLFQINRHGPDGDVRLEATTNTVIDTWITAEFPVAPSPFQHTNANLDTGPEMAYLRATTVNIGGGVSFRQQDLTITSDQSFFEGGVPSETNSSWQTGFAVGAGLSTFVCPNCMAGNPLKVGVEGRFRFFPSQSVSVPSVFGFTENGSTGSTFDYSAMVTVSVPFTLSDLRIQ